MSDQMLFNNRYRVAQKLGQGNTGDIFLVEDLFQEARQFALKIIRTDRINEAALTRFKQEFATMTRLKHPNLARVFEFGHDPASACYYLVMEMAGQLSLRDWLDQQKSFSLPVILHILTEIARALSFIHSRQVIHRDIKPHNVMLSLNEAGMPISVKLIDFGLADLENADNEIKGTLHYMAPEILSGPVSPATDIYACGLVAYELLTGSSFYDTDQPQAIIPILRNSDLHAAAQQQALSRIARSEVRSLLAQMTAYSPENRLAGGADIIHAINTWLGENFRLETLQTSEAYVLGAGFVGRKKELAGLIDFIQTGEKRLLLIKSSAGLGKSRLLQEFKNYCQLNRVHFLECRDLPEQSAPYDTLTTVLYQLAFDANDHLLNLYGPTLEKILPHHPRLAKWHNQIPFDPRTERSFLTRQIAGFLLAHSFSKIEPTVLFLNDIQWIDEASLESLTELFSKLKLPNDSKSSLRIYATIRNDDLERIRSLLDVFESDSLLETVELRPFNAEDAAAYIEQIFGFNQLSPGLRQAIPDMVTRVGGNPFFLQELLRTLVEQQFIVRERREWTLSRPIQQAQLPATIADLILSRVSRRQFSAKVMDFIFIAALLNRSFTTAELNDICQRTTIGEINQRVTELERLEIFCQEIMDDHVMYRFSHPLIREAIISAVPDLEWLHAHIARQMEHLYRHNLDAYVEELADHYQQAGDKLKAYYYLERAGNQAKSNFLYRKALAYYDQALSQLDSRESHAYVTVALKRGEIVTIMGKWQEAETIYRQCLKIAESLEDRLLIGHSSLGLAELLIRKSKLIESRPLLEQALVLYQAIEYGEGIANVMGRLGVISMMQRDFNQARNYFNWQCELAEKYNHKTALILALGNLGNIYNEERQYDKMQECYDRVLILAEQSNNRLAISITIGNLGECYFNQKRYQEAMDFYQKKLSYDASIGNRLQSSGILHQIGQIYIKFHDYENARLTYQKEYQIAEETGNIAHKVMALAELGHLEFTSGHYDKAFAFYRKASEKDTQVENAAYSGLLELYTAQIYRTAGDISAAQEGFELALEKARQANNLSLICDALTESADIFVDLRDWDNAGRRVEEAARIARSIGHDEVSFKSAVLTAKIAYGKATDRAVRRQVVAELVELAEAQTDEDRKAAVYYALYALTAAWEFGHHALLLYRALSEKTPIAEFRKRVNELSKIQRTVQAEGHDYLAKSVSPIEARMQYEAHTDRLIRLQDQTQLTLAKVGMLRERLHLLEESAAAEKNDPHYEMMQTGLAILDVIRIISTSLHLNDLLDSIIDSCIELSQAQRGFLILLEANGPMATDRQWFFQVGRHINQESLAGADFAISRSVVLKTIETGEPIFLQDALQNTDIGATESINKLNLLTIVCLPLVAPSSPKPFGVIYMDSEQNTHMVEAQLKHTLMMVANQAAIFIENARLYEKAEQRGYQLDEVNRQLQKLDHMKSAFINLTSHELRTPLAVLGGYLQLIKMCHEPSCDPEIKDYLNRCLEALGHLQKIVNTICDLSHLSRPQLQLDFAESSINCLIREVAQEIFPFMNKRNLHFESDLPEEDVRIQMHADSVWQILVNLLLNAIRYTQDGGTIRIHLKPAEDHVLIAVMDTGIGIPVSEHETIFKEFYTPKDIRYHHSGTIEFNSGGLGIGLSIAKALVDLHHGRIWVESQENEGSTFYISLPCVQSAATAAPG